MSKIKTCVPIYASAVGSIDKPDNWDKMSEKEKLDYFLENVEITASICHHCSKSGLSTDFEIDTEAYDKHFTMEDFFEEDR